MTRRNPLKIGSFPALIRLSWRHAWRRPLQSFFLIIGVAIGVAMIIAIDLANGAAQRAFELGTESVAGRATHQILGGPNGLDQQVYVDLRRTLDYRASAPVIEDYLVAPQLDGQPMRLLGVDPLAEAPFRSYLQVDGGISAASGSYLSVLLTKPNSVLLSATVAEQYAISVGDQLSIEIGGEQNEVEVVGLLAPSDDLSRRALDGLLIADIATAQELLDRVGQINRIDLIVPEGAAGEAALAQIESILPPSARVERSSARAGTVDEMTKAFRLNLTALSMLALVVGMFLIYNTVTFSVVQRRPVLGSLRALGMTQREIFALILGEAALLGIIGTLLGLGLGLLLGVGAVRLVTQTINDIFFVVAIREVTVPTFTLLKGAVIGILAALVGAAIPAIEATNVAPAGAMKRSNIEERARRALPWVTAGGVLSLALGAGLLIPEWTLIIAFFGLFAVIVGCALLTPALTLLLMTMTRTLFNVSAGVIERMAPRYIIRALSRTSVAVAALMVAVSVIIGVGVMIGSFRASVDEWLNDVLQADIFITSLDLTSNQVRSSLNPATVEQLKALPNIARLATTRWIDVVGYLSQEDVENKETLPIRLATFSDDFVGERRHYTESVGDWRETWQAMQEGAILINEPMANRTGLGVGDTLILQTDRGKLPFTIAGVVVDFDVDSVVLMHDERYRQQWDDTKVSAVALFVTEGTDVDEQIDAIRAAFAGKEKLFVRSNRGMRENALNVFDRTFAITVALQILATLVAFIGILSTLMSLQLERMREIGVLRANGMTRGQLWRMSLIETGLIGSSAGLLAIPTGYLLALILIYIINLRSFGWSLELQLQPGYFLRAFGVALLAALLAGIYPAWRMGLAQPADALRSE